MFQKASGIMQAPYILELAFFWKSSSPVYRILVFDNSANPVIHKINLIGKKTGSVRCLFALDVIQSSAEKGFAWLDFLLFVRGG